LGELEGKGKRRPEYFFSLFFHRLPWKGKGGLTEEKEKTTFPACKGKVGGNATGSREGSHAHLLFPLMPPERKREIFEAQEKSRRLRTSST